MRGLFLDDVGWHRRSVPVECIPSWALSSALSPAALVVATALAAGGQLQWKTPLAGGQPFEDITYEGAIHINQHTPLQSEAQATCRQQRSYVHPICLRSSTAIVEAPGFVRRFETHKTV
jgi:hypothetical protein